MDHRAPDRRGRRIALAAAVLITLYGGLLRLDALVGIYGPLDHPRWARFVTTDVASRVPAIRPSAVHWTRAAQPYVGGDPITYLNFAREMTSFYQAHVREPVFLALTRGALVLLDNQDQAVSLASLVGSTLAIFAIFLVGVELWSPVVGLIAALLTAIEFDIVTWAPEGWRDDTYMATVLFAAWALLRLRARPSLATAIAAGVLCGIACLTRITALAFVLPALAWIVVEPAATPRVERAKAAGIAAGFFCLVLGPYLINCAIATGDPLLAINYHTGYYRFAEHQPHEAPMSAMSYLRAKWLAHPLGTADVGFQGLFIQPFVSKWQGYRYWAPGLGTVARTLSLVGLVMLTTFGAGRLVLVVLAGTLVPYMFTWNLAGGNAWRFTMPVYPLFLAAAALAVASAVPAARRLASWRTAASSRAALAAALWRASPLLAAMAAGIAWYFLAPWFVIREDIRSGQGTTIDARSRNGLFFGSGWTGAHLDGLVVRLSRGERSEMRIPLPERRVYDLVLRVDPVTPTAPRRLDVLFNRRLVGRLPLALEDGRVGSYTVHITPDMLRRWSNSLELIPSETVTAASTGSRFPWVDPEARIGVRLWYVRVLAR